MPSLHASPLAPDGTSVPSNPSAQLGSAAALASGTRPGSASLSTSTTHCFHCGQPLGRDVTPVVADIGGQRRTFCCGGCQALAQTLYSAGFGHLYSDVTRFARPIDAQAR